MFTVLHNSDSSGVIGVFQTCSVRTYNPIVYSELKFKYLYMYVDIVTYRTISASLYSI